MKILIDFRDALVEYADTLGVHRDDTDSMWYVADLFDLLVRAALDSNKGYQESINRLVDKLEHETGESRGTCQSACDLAITQILNKMDEVFADLRHVDLFKTKKDISRAFNGSMSVYSIDIQSLPVSHIQPCYSDSGTRIPCAHSHI